MTHTKQRSDECPWKDDNGEDDSRHGGLSISQCKTNSVVNTTIIENKNVTMLRLDVMSIIGDEGRYYSLIYDLTTDNDTNGIFDFLDDFYSKKFGFFTSSKNNQSFLLALHRAEKKFFKDKCFNFKEYCERINESSIGHVMGNPAFKNVLDGKLTEGYTIGGEAEELYRQKHYAVSVSNHITEIGKSVVREFNSVIKEMNSKKFCCACINNTEKIPPSFLIDPIIGLPLLVYNREFAETFIKKTCRQFIESDVFKSAEIDGIDIDLWAVSPEMTTKDISKLMGEDGEIKDDYEEMCESDFNGKFLGKYDTLRFTRKSYRKDDEQQTVIGYS